MVCAGISMHLLHVILCACIFGACVQSANGRRIISRIRAKDFVIPLHHRKNAVNMKTGQTYVSQGASPICGDQCPPRWMGYIQDLPGLNANTTDPVCHFADVFTPCSETNNQCQSSMGVSFTCCPISCMKRVSCFTSDYLCLPQTLQPWIARMHTSNFW